MDVRLKFINKSNDRNSCDVVIFQKNVASSPGDTTVAWKVIQNCGNGDHEEFAFPIGMQVGTSDSYGNHTPRLNAEHGQLFVQQQTPVGHQFAYGGNAPSLNQVQVVNALPHGAIDANIFKDGHLLATQSAVAPHQKALFAFLPTIWVGMASESVQGQVMNAAVVSSIDTEFSLLGVASADIVMTGGGPGPHSAPFQFSLANVVMA